MHFGALDVTIVLIYAVFIFGLAQLVSREHAGHKKTAEDYFLAGKSLHWWAIGASLIAANISAEQIIGMSGSGYAIGLAIASYEWMAAITLIIVGKFFLPIFLRNEIYTMPQFLEKRYGTRIRTIMTIFWLLLYVFVNITSILWLGSIAVNAVTGMDQTQALVVIGVFALAYQLYGGLKAVALTDIVQVTLLVAGGLIISFMALSKIGGDGGALAGFATLTANAPDHFHMILDRASPYYKDLPGISVLIGGMWIMNISYWGFNQYIIQRALAAKNIREAQKGIAFAAFLKLLMPVIVVLPGIAATQIVPDLAKPDHAYPTMMGLLPSGLLGLVFAALCAAIVASLASKINSVSTIFTLDFYQHLRPEASSAHLLRVGRIAAVVALAIGLISARPLLGDFDQAFQYIQEFTGFFTPGIVVIFMLGLFWKPASEAGAIAAAIGSFGLSAGFKFLAPSIPFMDRVGLVFLGCAVLAIGVSLLRPQASGGNSIVVRDVSFATARSYNVSAAIVAAILIALYAIWW